MPRARPTFARLLSMRESRSFNSVFQVQTHRLSGGQLSAGCAIVGRTPSSARVPLDPLPGGVWKTRMKSRRPTGASAADEGVCPTSGALPRDGMFWRLRPQTEFRSQPILPASADRCPGSSGGLAGEHQAVADPRLSKQVARMGGVRLDLLSKLIDEDPQVFHLVAVVRPPHRL